MKVTIKVPGSCGELAQGFFGGEPILITCPIAKFSTVTVSDEFLSVEGLGEKSLAMLVKTLEFLSAPELSAEKISGGEKSLARLKLLSAPENLGMCSTLPAAEKISGENSGGEKSLARLKLLSAPENLGMCSTLPAAGKISGENSGGEKSSVRLKLLGAPENLGMRLISELPRAKGMASSSADLAAVAKAVARFLGREISAEKISELAASIEPTDGIFFKGIVAMNPVTGKFIKNINVAENLIVAVFDYGGEVDTLKFNRRSNFQIPALDETLDFKLVEASARANQAILHKKNLPEITAFAKSLGAVTVNAAHSGTVIGIFFRAADSEVDAKISEIGGRFEFIKFFVKTRLIGGGFYGEI